MSLDSELDWWDMIGKNFARCTILRVSLDKTTARGFRSTKTSAGSAARRVEYPRENEEYRCATLLDGLG